MTNINQKMAFSKDTKKIKKNFHQTVVFNSNTSLDTLIELSNSVDKKIADLAKLNLEKYQKLIQQARNENTTPEILTQLARDTSKTIRQYVAINPNTPIKTLEKLSQSFSNEITENPIFNLLLLENTESFFVRLTLARNSTTEPKILSKLIDFERISVKYLEIIYAVARNPNTPTINIETLLNWCPNHYFNNNYNINVSRIEDDIAYNVSINESTPSYCLKHLAKKISKQIHDRIPTNNKGYAETYRIYRLQKTLKFKTLRAISNHQNASTDLLEYLAGENCEVIQQNILNHQNVSKNAVDIIKYIQGEQTESHSSLLEKFAKDSRAEVRKLVARDRNASSAILAELGRDSNMQVLLAVAQNHQTTSCILEKLATILNQEIYKAIGKHHNISPKAKYIMEFMKSINPVKIPDSILEELINSDRVLVRMKIVQHEFTPAHILEKLTTDPDKYIRDTAHKNLSTKNHSINSV